MPTKAYSETMKDIQGLRYHPSRLREDLAEIAADPRRSDAYKAELADAARANRIAQTKADATATWKRAQRRLEAAKNALAETVQQQDTGLNWSKIQVLSAEYRAQLGSYRGLSETPASRFLAVANQARHTPEGRRALLLAGADLINNGDSGDPHMSDARRVAREWKAEADAPRQAAELEAHHAELGLGEIRNAILAIESEVTGFRPGVFAHISPWQKDIFGEDAFNTGRIVWRSEPLAIGGNPLPTMPDGVLTSDK